MIGAIGARRKLEGEQKKKLIGYIKSQQQQHNLERKRTRHLTAHVQMERTELRDFCQNYNQTIDKQVHLIKIDPKMQTNEHYLNKNETTGDPNKGPNKQNRRQSCAQRM